MNHKLLGVRQDASDDEIRKAYKKGALQWHPDKNMDNLELANEKFRLVCIYLWSFFKYPN